MAKDKRLPPPPESGEGAKLEEQPPPPESGEGDASPPPSSLSDLARHEMVRVRAADSRAARQREQGEQTRERARTDAQTELYVALCARIEKAEAAKAIEPGHRVYIVRPDQGSNVVIRGQCFRPGDLFAARPEEVKTLRDVVSEL